MTQPPDSADARFDFNQHRLEDWQALATTSLLGRSLASLAHTTANGLGVEPLYVDRPQAQTNLAPQPLQRWDNRLSVIGESASAQNAALLTGLGGGISSAQIQIHSEELQAGIGIDQLPAVLDGVQLEIVPISFHAGTGFKSAFAQLEDVWSAQGVAADKARASINADPIGTLARAGALANGLDESLAELCELSERVSHVYPNTNTVCVNSVYHHNAGASLVQELVASLATASVYMQSMINKGLSPQLAHKAIVFQVGCDADLLANVTKLRALKTLWLHVAVHFGVVEPTLQLVAETSLRMQSTLEPWVNHLRNVSAATAAAIGGANSIVVHQHNRVDNQYLDEEISLGARVARNIPIILSEESAMTFIHDPMGGSYAVENMTKQLVDKSWQSLVELEQAGGLVNALQSGQWQTQIAQTQMQRVERLATEQDIQVAVNRYTNTKTSTVQQTDATQADTKALHPVREAIAFEGTS